MIVDALITETADRLFSEICTHDAVQDAEDRGDPGQIWEAFAETGFAWISVPEHAGGSGGSLADALEVLRLVGYHRAPIPAAETSILGGWLLAEAGLALPRGIVTVAPGHPTDSIRLVPGASGGVEVTGTVSMVPWGRCAERLALIVDGRVVSVAVANAVVEPQLSLAGEPRDTLIFDGAEADVGEPPQGVDAEALRFRGALSRVALVGGAIEKMSQLTVSYCQQRQQFGQPIARFQAVQQHLVWAAQDAALARMCAESAARQATRDTAEFEIAAAKLNANQAATRATKACHQAHGAMGMTQEYPLHHYSRRLWAWRSEYGGTQHWARWVGQKAVALGADRLYPLIAGGSAELGSSGSVG